MKTKAKIVCDRCHEGQIPNDAGGQSDPLWLPCPKCGGNFRQDKTAKQIAAEYKGFIADTGGVCWRCGRGWSDKPHWYWAEWRIDPHHIVRKPRKNDRRVVIPLCAACHSVEHGAKHTAFDLSSGGKFPGCKPVPLTLEDAIRIKAERDKAFFDPEFLASCSVKRELVLSICREIQKGTDE